MARVLSIHVGKAKQLSNAKPGKLSAIDKHVIDGPVRFTAHGLEGDEQVELPAHGGPFKAVCVYASEYYPECSSIAGTDMPHGSFGENLVLEGLLDPEICLGDIYTLGDVELEVCGPRGPCSNLSKHWGGRNDFHLELKRRRMTGAYMRVNKEGAAAAGNEIIRTTRPHPHWDLVSLWDAIDGVDPKRQEIDELLGIDSLDDDWKPRLRAMLERL